MKKYIKLIRHPRVVLQYINKYIRIGIRKGLYNFRVQNDFNFHKARLEKALKATRTKSKEDLFVKWKNGAGSVFATKELENIYFQGDIEVREKVLEQAKHVLNNSFYILYDYVDNRIDSNGHYKWFEDYRTQYSYKMTFYMNARAANRNEGTDIKRIWEMARLQYLFAPAMAYKLTNDNRYAEKVKDILMDFSNQNLKYCGPNWNPSMEVGIRAANIVLVLELIGSASCIDEDFVCEMVGLLIDHVEVILENEENIGGKTSNHYLGGILGLAAVSAYLPFFQKSKMIAGYVYEAVNREIKKQILDDGGDYEGSTSYHRLVGELFGFSMIASQCSGYQYSVEIMKRLFKMVEFTQNIISTQHKVIQMGDNDSGRVFQLIPEQPNDHRFMISLVSGVYFQQNKNLYEKEQLFANVGKERQWIAPDFGIGRISDDIFDLFVGCINSQKYGMGGHIHNDIGSFLINCRGFEVVVDPGSGSYTGTPEIRNRMRSVDSHSAIKINNKEPRKSGESGLFVWDSLFDVAEIEKTSVGFLVKMVQDGITVNRHFVLEKQSIFIHDNIEGSLECASMKIIFSPGIEVTTVDSNTVEIMGAFGKIRFSGTWTIIKTENEYSPSYDKVVITNALLCTSYSDKNSLKIEYTSEGSLK